MSNKTDIAVSKRASSLKVKFQSRPGHYFSTKEVASLFEVSETTIKRWCNSGKLKCLRSVGGHRKYTSELILEFIETFKGDDGSAVVESTHRNEKPGEKSLAYLMLEKDFHTLCRVYVADALEGNSEDLVRTLVECRSRAKIPLTVIYNEIVEKAIDRIESLARRRKLNGHQRNRAISAILESFVRFRSLRHSQSTE